MSPIGLACQLPLKLMFSECLIQTQCHSLNPAAVLGARGDTNRLLEKKLAAIEWTGHAHGLHSKEHTSVEAHLRRIASNSRSFAA